MLATTVPSVDYRCATIAKRDKASDISNEAAIDQVVRLIHKEENGLTSFVMFEYPSKVDLRYGLSK